MKIAILIACSEYTHASKLVACKNDLETMSQLLHSSNEFTDIFESFNESSQIVNDRLISFIENHKDKKIEQVFFYFSGHGSRDTEDFYFCLTQTDPNLLKSTTISNTTLDGYLRTLNPNIAIKVVDACQSGENYIKDTDDFLKENTNTFNELYFMFSSKSTELSEATLKYSKFTKLFFEAIHSQKDINRITYKSIIDYITDRAKVELNHTPQFVAQGSFTAFMFDNLEEIKKILDQNIETQTIEVRTTPAKNNLIALIQKDSERYCSEKDGLEKISQIFKAISDYNFEDNELKQIFAIQPDIGTLYHLDLNTKSIGQWISEQKNKHEFLVRETTKEVEVEVELTPKEQLQRQIDFATSRSRHFSREIQTSKKITQKVIDSIKFLQELSQEAAILKFIPQENFLSVTDYAVCFTIVFSKSELFVFYNFEKLAMQNWSRASSPKCNNWKLQRFPLKQFNSDSLKNIFNRIEQFLLDDLNESFNIKSNIDSNIAIPSVKNNEPVNP